ncbi:MAG: hypothetical protein R3C69_09985 [Geminicoccaceae bacterium]
MAWQARGGPRQRRAQALGAPQRDWRSGHVLDRQAVIEQVLAGAVTMADKG